MEVPGIYSGRNHGRVKEYEFVRDAENIYQIYIADNSGSTGWYVDLWLADAEQEHQK